MIIYPSGWKTIGRKIKLKEIEDVILTVLTKINCNCLALSGGLDSSLLLYFMTRIFGNDIRCFTIALSKDHPDYIFSNLVSRYFNIDNEIYIPCIRLNSGDDITKAFYDNLAKLGVTEIISCDGIDEFMCGYYDHQKNPSEEVYFDYIRRLKNDHLVPLDKNSGDIKVYLPYLDSELISVLSQIPISEKVDSVCRKKMMVQLAEGRIIKEIIERRKYGFCDAMRIK